MTILALLESRRNVIVTEKFADTALAGVDKVRKHGGTIAKVAGGALGAYAAYKGAKMAVRGAKKLYTKLRGGDKQYSVTSAHGTRASGGIRANEAYAELLELSTGLKTKAALAAHRKGMAAHQSTMKNLGTASRTHGAVRAGAVSRASASGAEASKRYGQKQRFIQSAKDDRELASNWKRTKKVAKYAAGALGAYGAYKLGKALLARRAVNRFGGNAGMGGMS